MDVPTCLPIISERLLVINRRKSTQVLTIKRYKIKFSKDEIEDYKEEIQEFTELLNTEWSDLRDMLSEEIDLEDALLCSYFEDEEEGKYGAILTKDKQIYQFTVRGEDLEIVKVDNVRDIEEDYPQVVVALQL